MPRKPSRPPLVCEFFTWRLFQRDGVYYADGRTGRHNLGKHSLGTRDADEALSNLRRLDRQLAVQRGLASAATLTPSSDLSVREGWNLYLAHCQRPEVLGGVSPGTSKRYRAVQDKHLAFCDRGGIRLWAEVSKPSAESYARWLEQNGYASRSIYLEMTLIKSVILWLIAEKRLPPDCRLGLEIAKPQGTDTYCYTPEQVAAMIGHCWARPDLAWLAAVLVTLACTGLRIGEVASLRWSDFDIGLSTIRLTDDRSSRRRKALGTARRTKGRRDRVLPVHADLVEVLHRMER